MNRIKDGWNSGEQYEYYMGRWSKLMAAKFLKWLNMPPKLTWLDIGCGTGALSEAIYEKTNPMRLSCLDPSGEFLKIAKSKLPYEIDFIRGNVSNVPFAKGEFDVIVSGLALNFFPDLSGALSEMKRVLRANGTIAAYVWDYSAKMEFLRYFWDTAFEIDPDSHELDEGIRFPVCKQENLTGIFQMADLIDIESIVLDIDTVFINFEDYWNPFLGGQGPAPGYLSSLTENLKNELKLSLRKKLAVESDGSIRLLGRAIAIRGKTSHQ